jgi:predicted PurR-regulated permease PerM
MSSSGKTNIERRLWEIPAARDFGLIVFIALGLWFIYSLRAIFAPLLIALLLAHIANPLVTALEYRWRMPRSVTAAVLALSGVLACSIFFAWLGPLLLEQVTALVQRMPEYVNAIASRHGIETSNLLDLLNQALTDLQLNLQTLLAQLFKTTGRALDLVTTLFSTAAYLLLSFALLFFYFFVFSWRFNRGIARAARYVPESRRERTAEILSRMDQAVGHFFRGRLAIAIIMGILLSVGWFFAGVPYWFFLGMLTGLLNIVPYLSILTLPLALLLKYVDALTVSGADFSFISIAIWPTAVYVTVQLLESWLLTPWIQSTQTSLSAATVIIVVFIGAAVAGALGMLLAIPIAACLKILLQELVLPRLRRWAVEH